MILDLTVLLNIFNLFLFNNPVMFNTKTYSDVLSSVAMPSGRPMPCDRTLHKLIKIRDGYKPKTGIRIDSGFKAWDAGALIIGEALVSKAPQKAVKWFKKARHSRLRQIRIRAAFGLIRAFIGIGKPNQALKVIEKQGHKRLSMAQMANLLFLKSKAMPDRAGALLKRLFIQFPTSRWADSKITGLHESNLSDEEMFSRAEGFSRALDHGEAARIYDILHKKGFKPVQTAWRLARILLFKLRAHPKRALKLLNEVEKARGISGDFLMARAKAYKMLERYDEAAKVYRIYLSRYPGGRYHVKCRYYLGWLPYDHGKYKQAIPLFDSFLRRYRHSSLRTYILWFKAWSLIKMKRLVKAAKVLKRMIPYGNNLVAGKAMYWLGVIAYRLNDFELSKQWFKQLIARYPMTYYSVLAWRRMGQWYGGPSIPAWVNVPKKAGPFKPYWGMDRLKGYYRNLILRVRALTLLGFRNEAFRVYRRHRHRIERLFKGQDAVRFMHTVYGMTGQWHRLGKNGKKRFRSLFGPVPAKQSLGYWSLLYPRAESWFVRPYARQEGIDPLWVYAIMRQESRFSLSKVSVADAIGIMQMIPETAKRVARELHTTYNPVDFFKPGVNTRFCVHYLASLFRDFKGQIVFASAAYNGGAPPIRRMMLANSKAPMDRMVEDIAYNQSRNYCRKVAEHLLRYISIYASPVRRRRILKALYPDPVDYDLGNKVDY